MLEPSQVLLQVRVPVASVQKTTIRGGTVKVLEENEGLLPPLKHLIVGLSPLGSALPSGLYGEQESKDAKQRGDEERRRQCWDLAHPGGIA